MRFDLPDGTVDLAAGEIRRADQTVALRPIEVRLLAYLAARPDQLVAVDTLLRDVWDYSPKVKSRGVYFAIRRLRDRLEPDPRHPTVLVGTERRGFGLRMGMAVPPDLVGRDDEVARIAALLARPGALVGITGPAGMGKSRVLAEVARRTGARRIDAEGLVDDHELAMAGAETLGAIDHADALGVEGLGALSRWRQRFPRARMLLASRVPVPLHDVVHVPLPPLSRDAAARLFEGRRGAGVTGDSSDRDALLDELDGVPLAIELAAVRARTLPLARIRDEVMRDPGTLAAPLADTAPRHWSLDAAISASIAALSESESEALARLCALDAAVPVEAALAVIGEDSSALSALVDRGLLRVGSSGSTAVYGPFRAVRTLVRTRRPASDAPLWLARWWLDRIRGTPFARGPFARATHPALLGAAQAVVDSGDLDCGAIVVACLELAHHEGAHPGHERLAERALALPLDPGSRARIAWHHAVLHPLAGADAGALVDALDALQAVASPEEVVRAGQFAARVCITRSGNVALARRILDRIRPLAARAGLEVLVDIEASVVARAGGQLAEAAIMAERAVAGSRSSPQWLSRALGALAFVRADQGQTDEAVAHTAATLALDAGADERRRAAGLLRHALMLRAASRFDEARAVLGETLTVYERLGDLRGRINVAITLALVALDVGAAEEARRLLLDFLPQAAATLDFRSVTEMRALLELARLRAGHAPSGFDTEAVVALVLPGSILDEAVFLAWCAEIAARSGARDIGRRHLEAVEARVTRIGGRAAGPGRTVAALRSLVDPSPG